MRKKKLVYYLIFLITVLGTLVYCAVKETHSVQRDIPTLLNFYYNYKDKKPLKAKEAIDLILQQDPLNSLAIHEKINWFIKQGDTNSALSFLKNYQKKYSENADIAYELANLYLVLNITTKAKPILKKLSQSNNQVIKKKSISLYQLYFPKENISHAQISALQSFIEPLEIKKKQELDHLYTQIQDIIKVQPNSARRYLHMIISAYPNEYKAYTKLGYLELQHNNPDVALQYFLKSFAIKQNTKLAVQIGYLYAKKK